MKRFLLSLVFLLLLSAGEAQSQTFEALCGGGASCAYTAADPRWGYQTANKIRINFNVIWNFITTIPDCDNVTTSKLVYDAATKVWTCTTDQTGGGGLGDVVGPASATDNAIARYNLTTGKLIQNSAITIADGATGALSGTNTGDQTITLTGDVTGTGTGSFAATIAAGAIITSKILDANVTYAKIQDMSAASRLLGRGSAGGAGDVEEIILGSGLSMSANTLSASGGGGGSPDNALYVTLATDSTLTAERVLTAGGNITLTDSGANGTITIKTPISIGITVDGAGSVITTGVKGFVVAPSTCTIDQSTLLSTDASATAGSIVIDVWKDTYANYPPTVADTIAASAKPTLSSANKAQDTTLTGWTKTVTQGDIIGFKVDSATTVTRVTLILRCQ
jgi:hypothetical protein